MNFTLKLAGVPIQVVHRFPYIQCLCTDYRTDDAPAFAVSVTDEQIDTEMRLTAGRYSRELCETTCLHREIVKGLVPYGVILIHSAVIAVDGEAYVFLAKSGVGKSTHIHLWQSYFGDRAVIVNGDKPLFSYVNGTLTVHGTPWRGKELWGHRMSCPVKAFCLLERGLQNRIQPCTHADIVPKLFNQVLLPTSNSNVASLMGFLNRVIRTIPFYHLTCNMEQEAALVAYEGMQKE